MIKKAATVKKKKTPVKKIMKKEILEYYDLPNTYQNTVVKVLAQTPKSLFVYWDISDVNKKEIPKNSRPILLVQNQTMNYEFEVEINDYANSWYIAVNDSSCDYKVTLCRKTNVLHKITASNTIESPNDHILFEKIPKAVQFKNIKTEAIRTVPTKNTQLYQDQIRKVYEMLPKEQIHETPSSDFANGGRS